MSFWPASDMYQLTLVCTQVEAVSTLLQSWLLVSCKHSGAFPSLACKRRSSAGLSLQTALSFPCLCCALLHCFHQALIVGYVSSTQSTVELFTLHPVNDSHQLASELVCRRLWASSKCVGVVFSPSVKYIPALIFWILFWPSNVW